MSCWFETPYTPESETHIWRGRQNLVCQRRPLCVDPHSGPCSMPWGATWPQFAPPPPQTDTHGPPKEPVLGESYVQAMF